MNSAYPFVISHWQGRPKGKRTFGYYADGGRTRNYYVVLGGVANSVIHIPSSHHELDETQHNTLPTAVVVYKNAKITESSERYWLEQVRALY